MPIELRSPVKRWVQKKLDLTPLVEQKALILRNAREWSGPKPTESAADDRYLSNPNHRDDNEHRSTQREHRSPQKEFYRYSSHRDHWRQLSERTVYEQDRADREEAIARQDRAIVSQEVSRRDQEDLLAQQLEAKARQRTAEDRIHEIDVARARRMHEQNRSLRAEQQDFRPRESDILRENRLLRTPNRRQARNDHGSWSSGSNSVDEEVSSSGREYKYNQANQASREARSGNEYRSTKASRKLGPDQNPRSFSVFRDDLDGDVPGHHPISQDGRRIRRNYDYRYVDSTTLEARPAEVLTRETMAKTKPLSKKQQEAPPLNLTTKSRRPNGFGMKEDQYSPVDRRPNESRAPLEPFETEVGDENKRNKPHGGLQSPFRRPHDSDFGQADSGEFLKVKDPPPTPVSPLQFPNKEPFSKLKDLDRQPRNCEHIRRENSISIPRPDPSHDSPIMIVPKVTAPAQKQPMAPPVPPKIQLTKPLYPPVSNPASDWHLPPESPKPPIGDGFDSLSILETKRKVHFADSATTNQKEDTSNNSRRRSSRQPLNGHLMPCQPPKFPPRDALIPTEIPEPVSQKRVLKYDPVRDSASTWTQPDIDRNTNTTYVTNDRILSQHPRPAVAAERQGPAITPLPPPPSNLPKPKTSTFPSDPTYPRQSRSTGDSRSRTNVGVPSLEDYAEHKRWRDV